MVQNYNNNELLEIIQRSLLVTTGDNLKILRVDAATGELKPEQKSTLSDNFEPLCKAYNLGQSLRDGRLEPQFLLQPSSLKETQFV